MKIRTIIIHGEKTYKSALGKELDEQQFKDIKEYMAQQQPLSSMNIEDENGNQLYFGKKVIEESIIMFEKIENGNVAV